MCDEQEDKRSEMGIFQYEQALTKATEELLTDLEKTIRSKPMARIITKMDIGSDIDLVLKEGKCNWKVRQKLIDLALHKIVY